MAMISLFRLSKCKQKQTWPYYNSSRYDSCHTTTAAGMIHGRLSQDIFPTNMHQDYYN